MARAKASPRASAVKKTETATIKKTPARAAKKPASSAKKSTTTVNTPKTGSRAANKTGKSPATTVSKQTPKKKTPVKKTIRKTTKAAPKATKAKAPAVPKRAVQGKVGRPKATPVAPEPPAPVPAQLVVAPRPTQYPDPGPELNYQDMLSNDTTSTFAVQPSTAVTQASPSKEPPKTTTSSYQKVNKWLQRINPYTADREHEPLPMDIPLPFPEAFKQQHPVYLTCFGYPEMTEEIADKIMYLYQCIDKIMPSIPKHLHGRLHDLAPYLNSLVPAGIKQGAGPEWLLGRVNNHFLMVVRLCLQNVPSLQPFLKKMHADKPEFFDPACLP